MQVDVACLCRGLQVRIKGNNSIQACMGFYVHVQNCGCVLAFVWEKAILQRKIGRQSAHIEAPV